jgi:hypothetical protein
MLELAVELGFQLLELGDGELCHVDCEDLAAIKQCIGLTYSGRSRAGPVLRPFWIL